MSKKVLILCSRNDKSVAKVADEVARLCGSVSLCYPLPFTRESSISLRHDKIDSFHGNLMVETRVGDRTHDERLSVKDIGCAWFIRPGVGVKITNVGLSAQQQVAQSEAKACLRSFYDCIRATWVNHPRAVNNVEDNKLYQLSVASNVGLRTPETLITNDPDELIAFATAMGGKIAVKPLFTRLFTVDGEVSFVYTNLIDTEWIANHKEQVRVAPVLAQRYVAKKFEVRTTVIGGRMLSCAIYSQQSKRSNIDWRRYDIDNTPHKPYSLPFDIEGQLINCMQALNLQFGAADFVVTPEGEHVFLEVNPSGQWGWVERLTGLNITGMIAEHLISAL
ncbi:MAG: hypothetical protein AAB590_02860 [Patescibacteria group bacterium]